MSEGRPVGTKSTIYVGNLADDIDEQALIEVFSTFGTPLTEPFLHE
jgi:RNA recognition motif-containing protein